MKTVRNNPKTYKRREVTAPKTHRVISDAQKEKTFAEFVDGKISKDLYIELLPKSPSSRR